MRESTGRLPITQKRDPKRMNTLYESSLGIRTARQPFKSTASNSVIINSAENLGQSGSSGGNFSPQVIEEPKIVHITGSNQKMTEGLIIEAESEDGDVEFEFSEHRISDVPLRLMSAQYYTKPVQDEQYLFEKINNAQQQTEEDEGDLDLSLLE